MAKKDKVGGSKISFKAQPKKKKSGPPTDAAPYPRLKQHYADVVAPALKEKYGYGSPLATPRITKVVVSMGVGDAHENPRKFETLIEQMETVTGQRPQVTRARVSDRKP